MCPACIATVAWIAAGTASTGISALVVSNFRGKKLPGDKEDPTTNKKKPE